MLSYYFSIIGTKDNPLYELEFSSFKSSSPTPGQSQFSASVKEILPFVTHSALDIVEDATWSTNQFSLGRIDSFYGLVINAFITQGNIKFLLCYDTNAAASGSGSGSGVGGVGGSGSGAGIVPGPGVGAASHVLSSSSSSISGSKNDDNSIKQFFMEVNDLYVKCLLNPLYAVNDAIISPDFDLKVKILAKKYL